MNHFIVFASDRDFARSLHLYAENQQVQPARQLPGSFFYQ